MGLIISTLGLDKWITKYNAWENTYWGSWHIEADAQCITFLLSSSPVFNCVAGAGSELWMTNYWRLESNGHSWLINVVCPFTSQVNKAVNFFLGQHSPLLWRKCLSVPFQLIGPSRKGSEPFGVTDLEYLCLRHRAAGGATLKCCSQFSYGIALVLLRHKRKGFPWSLVLIL